MFFFTDAFGESSALSVSPVSTGPAIYICKDSLLQSVFGAKAAF
jgi:hypothetical protein